MLIPKKVKPGSENWSALARCTPYSNFYCQAKHRNKPVA